MARTTLLFGILLIALGIVFFILTGNAHPTALIPTVIGLFLALCSYFARTENTKARMVWMHTAVTIGLIGFIGAVIRIIGAYVHAHGAPLAHPNIVREQALMSALCLIFVLLCVRSFIAARRERLA